jgi:hypothetical protein
VDARAVGQKAKYSQGADVFQQRTLVTVSRRRTERISRRSRSEGFSARCRRSRPCIRGRETDPAIASRASIGNRQTYRQEWTLSNRHASARRRSSLESEPSALGACLSFDGSRDVFRRRVVRMVSGGQCAFLGHQVTSVGFRHRQVDIGLQQLAQVGAHAGHIARGRRPGSSSLHDSKLVQDR